MLGERAAYGRNAVRPAAARSSPEVRIQHSPLQLARFLIDTMNGLSVTAKATRDRKVLDDVVNVALAALKQ